MLFRLKSANRKSKKLVKNAMGQNTILRLMNIKNGMTKLV